MTKTFCQLRKKLVEDNPGYHHFKWACRLCNQEYGPEFAEPHVSTCEIARAKGLVVRADPIPRVEPGVCPSWSSGGSEREKRENILYLLPPGVLGHLLSKHIEA